MSTAIEILTKAYEAAEDRRIRLIEEHRGLTNSYEIAMREINLAAREATQLADALTLLERDQATHEGTKAAEDE